MTWILVPVMGRSGPIISSALQWKILPVGAGGFNQGASIGFDGVTQTLMVRTDTYGAYRFDPTGTSPIGTTGTWTQLIRADTMPSDYVNGSVGQSSQGVYEIQMCYSTPTIAYMTAADVNAANTNNATVFKTTNFGNNWTRTGFTPIPGGNAPPNDPNWKHHGPKICINPSDSTKLYVGTQPTVSCSSGTISGSVLTVAGAVLSNFAVGQWVFGAGVTAGTKITSLGTGTGGNGTYNLSASSTVLSGVPMVGSPTALGPLALSTDGGSTWNPVSASQITPSTAGGYSGMCWSRSNTSNIYIGSNGNGIYFSNDGGTTFNKLVGGGTGPTNISWADIDENTGAYWVVDYATGALWKWNGTTWSNPISGTANNSSVAVDPNTANRIIFFSNDTLFESTNGTTFGSASGTNTYTLDTGDIPWVPNTTSGFGTNATYFDRTISNRIYGVFNLGSQVSTWSGSVAGAAVTHTFRSRGIEQQVGLEVVVPPGGNPIACVWDNGIFPKSSPFNTSYPTTLRPSATSGTQTAAWSCDYAFGTPTFLVMVGDGQYESGSSQAWTSSDGGNTWSSIQSTMPISQNNGASVAVSTTTNFIFGDGNTRQPYFTTNGGTTWTAITLPGTPNFTSPQLGGFQGRGKWIIADKVNSNSFAIMYAVPFSSAAPSGFFTTTNSGTSWSGPFNGTVTSQLNGDSIMKAVPGQAGHAFICNPVPVGTGGAGGGTYFGYTANMYAGVSQAWTQITNVSYAQSFGFGAAAPGKSYPTIGYTGYSAYPCSNGVSIGTGTNITFNLTGSPGHTILPGSAVWMHSNGNGDERGSVVSYIGGVLTVNIDTVISGSGGPFSNWVAQIYGTYTTEGNSVPGATPIWKQMAAFPNNSLDICQGVSGDPNTYGRWYLSFGGSSFLVLA